MKRKSNKYSSKVPLNPAVDLFGQVQVTDEDVEQWVAVVAPRWYGTRRMEFYIREWNIASKVAYAKLNGTFDQVKKQACELVDCSTCLGRFAK